jgi:sulfotransferase family protein
MTRYVLVVGAQRCGTTYLYELLDEHPEIAMAKPARPEPKFFLDAEKCRRGLTWYETTYFADAEAVPVHGEKSTSYIESPEAAERAAGMIPDADVLVMLRDPIDRAISNWRFSTASGLEERPVEQALAENLEGTQPWDRSATSVSPFAYLERGRYVDFLIPWQRFFPQRLHVLFLEEFAGNSEAIARMYQAIGVDAAFPPPSLSTRVNAAEQRTPGIDSSLANRLVDYFKESNDRLRDYLGRDLPWKHEVRST